MLLDKEFKRKTYIIDSSYYICNKEYITYQDILIILDANCVLVITWTFKRKIINVYIQTLIIIYKKSYISKKRRLVRAVRETSNFPNWSLLTFFSVIFESQHKFIGNDRHHHFSRQSGQCCKGRLTKCYYNYYYNYYNNSWYIYMYLIHIMKADKLFQISCFYNLDPVARQLVNFN